MKIKVNLINWKIIRLTSLSNTFASFNVVIIVINIVNALNTFTLFLPSLNFRINSNAFGHKSSIEIELDVECDMAKLVVISNKSVSKKFLIETSIFQWFLTVVLKRTDYVVYK